MAVEWKVCNNCNRKVNKVANKCPYCDSTSFTAHKEEITHSSNQDDINLLDFLKYPLFYSKYERYNVFLFSRAKFINVVAFCLIFIYFMHSSTNYLISTILVLIFFIPVYIITHIAHSMAENESAIRTKIKNREDSLIDNIIHFLFYWHDEDTNIFTFSKTKTISLLIYVVFVLYRSFSSTSFLAEVFIGLFLFVPALLIGSLIHYLLLDREQEKKEITNTPPEPKVIQKPKEVTPIKQIKKESKLKQDNKKPIFDSYKIQVNNLKSKFDIKEKNVRDLIEKRFPSPQITNAKFNSIVDECCEVFNQKTEVISTIVDSTTEYSSKIENELKSNINVLKEINIKLDNLTNELVIALSEEKNTGVDDLLEDIDKLTDSIKDYK